MRQIREEDHAVVMVDDGQVVAEVGYKSIDDHSLVIDHTFVSEQLRGQKSARSSSTEWLIWQGISIKRLFLLARTRLLCSSAIRNTVTYGSNEYGSSRLFNCITDTTPERVIRPSRCFLCA